MVEKRWSALNGAPSLGIVQFPKKDIEIKGASYTRTFVFEFSR